MEKERKTLKKADESFREIQGVKKQKSDYETLLLKIEKLQSARAEMEQKRTRIESLPVAKRISDEWQALKNLQTKKTALLLEEKEKRISNQYNRRKRASTLQKSEKSSLLRVQGFRLPIRCSVSFLQSRSLPAPGRVSPLSCVPFQPLHSDPSTCHPHTSCLCISTSKRRKLKIINKVNFL